MNSLNDIVKDGTRVARELPEIVPFFKIWRQKATGLRILHAFLGVSSVFFSLLTTTVLQFNGTNWNTYAKVFAFIAAVSIGLMTAFNLGTKSNDMTRAWRKLTAAIIRYNKYIIQKQKVVDQYVGAERLIGDVTFDQSLVPNHDGETTGNINNDNDGTGPNKTPDKKDGTGPNKTPDKKDGTGPNKTPDEHNIIDSANKSKSEPVDGSL